MRHTRQSTRRLVEALREGVAKNHEQIYKAVMCTEPDCLNHELGVYILKEAGYTVGGFLAAHIRGDFDV